MNKSDLLNRLQEEYLRWEEFLDQIDPAHMEQPGVNGNWSMKDMVVHLTTWNRWLVTRMQAAAGGEPEALPPWPASLKSEDEINAWIYESNRERPLDEIRNQSRQVHQELMAVLEGLHEDARIERVEPAYYLVWVNGTRFEASEFFDHFRDDHEPDVRTWLKRMETVPAMQRRNPKS